MLTVGGTRGFQLVEENEAFRDWFYNQESDIKVAHHEWEFDVW